MYKLYMYISAILDMTLTQDVCSYKLKQIVSSSSGAESDSKMYGFPLHRTGTTPDKKTYHGFFLPVARHGQIF